MRHDWSIEELVESWTLVGPDWALIANRAGPTRLGFALSLKFFELQARFAFSATQFSPVVVNFVARQVNVMPERLAEHVWDGRSATYHRAQIREAFGFRVCTRTDESALTAWLVENVCPVDVRDDLLIEAVRRECRSRRLESPGRVDRIAGSARNNFDARDPRWWGTGTSCASDSKKFGSWESNLMTEWHNRYGGPGVMIYWHVERRSTCIYSQLKNCSSSEVAVMIEGLLRHDTDVPVENNYVDTHGASIVGFAFTELLGFRLCHD